MINILPGVNGISSALNAERIRMEVISQNIANANMSQGLDGKPYQRQYVVFEAALNDQQKQLGGSSVQPSTLHVSRIEKDNRPPRPLFVGVGHPEADASGNKYVPDISIHEEMADYIASSRAFEANLAVVKTARTLALQTLAIGKR